MTPRVPTPRRPPVPDDPGAPADPTVPPSSEAVHMTLGRRGEQWALRQLVARGLVQLDRNWRCDAGELDLVMLDGSVVVAVEVKTRRSTGRGHPVEAVDAQKLERLHRLVWRWLGEHGVRATGVRVDVVGVVWPHRGSPAMTYVQGVA